MNREEIKQIVYKYAADIFANQNELYDFVNKYPNDGEDLFIYSEIGFDMLDTALFIERLEKKKFNMIIPNKLITYEVTLRIIIDYLYSTYSKQA